MSYSNIFTQYNAIQPSQSFFPSEPTEDTNFEENSSLWNIDDALTNISLKFRSSYPDIVPPEENVKPEIQTLEDYTVFLLEPVKEYRKPSRKLTGPKEFEKAFLEALKIDPSISKYKDFLTKTADVESNFDSKRLNRAGAPYYGYFLMGILEIKRTTGLSVEEFRNDPVRQILGAAELYKLNLKVIKAIGAYKLGKEKGYSDDAMIAGAWLGGPGGVKKYLLGQGNPSDSHWYGGKGGTSVGARMNEFNK